MTTHLGFLLLGLAAGSVYASLAMGLVLFYRSSGVVNFATGAMALFGAYEYGYLRQGQIVNPIPGLPTFVSIGGSDIGFVPAALGAMALTALLSLLLYLLVFRPLRNAPPVAAAVASIGIMVIITEDVSLRVGSSALTVTNIFPTTVYQWGSFHISADRIWFAGTVILVALAIAAAFRFTRFGLQTRAVSESEKGAFLSGISPGRIAASNWMIGGAVAGLAGLLIAPIVPLTPVSYTFFIIPALAATVIGRFQSLISGVLVGLGIGMVQSEVTYLQSTQHWLPKSGVPEMVPLILIIIFLVFRSQPLPTRGALIRTTLGRAPRPTLIVAPAVVAGVIGLILLLVLNHAWRASLASSFTLGIIALSIVVVTGFAGQVSLAQVTIAGVAAFTLSPVTESWGVPFPLAPILAALVATAIGVVVGLPALRIRGLIVAVVTLSLAVAIQAVWFQNNQFVPTDGRPIKSPSLFGIDLSVGEGVTFPRLSYCITVLIILIISGVVVALLRTSRFGSEMLAVRANERSAAAAGVNVVRTKIIAFASAAFIAGIGGSLVAYQQTTATFNQFDVLLGLGIFAGVYVAGITSVSGGILAGVLGTGGIVWYASVKWLHLGDWYGLIMAVLLVLTVIFNPEGLVGPVHDALERRRHARNDPSAEALVTARSTEGFSMPDADQHQLGGLVLTISDVTVRYGGVTAVNDVSFSVREGAIVGLIGPNGAGKTTLIDAITGFAPASGSFMLDGVDLTRMAPHQRVRAGLARTFQAIELWNDLTVADNVVVGLAAAGDRWEGAEEHPLRSTLSLLGIEELAHRPAGELSQGQRQLVSIARALISRPKVLLLDEPAGGLDTEESRWLGARLQRIRDAGTSILMVDHDMGLVLNLCDEIQVLDFGSLIASGTPERVRQDERVARAYLGSAHAGGDAG
jgi:ABC-type branched-subunit amino acid transport system ATPase component/branched-subunit amino acid ABC-type transport system permease component